MLQILRLHGSAAIAEAGYRITGEGRSIVVTLLVHSTDDVSAGARLYSSASRSFRLPAPQVDYNVAGEFNGRRMQEQLFERLWEDTVLRIRNMGVRMPLCTACVFGVGGHGAQRNVGEGTCVYYMYSALHQRVCCCYGEGIHQRKDSSIKGGIFLRMCCWCFVLVDRRDIRE